MTPNKTTLRILEIVQAVQAKGEKMPSYQAIADMAGTTKGVVQHTLVRLRERGEIKRWGRPGSGGRPGKFHAKGDPAKRSCLGCKRVFPSWGKGNRMCNRCKQIAAHGGSVGPI